MYVRRWYVCMYVYLYFFQKRVGYCKYDGYMRMRCSDVMRYDRRTSDLAV